MTLFTFIFYLILHWIALNSVFASNDGKIDQASLTNQEQESPLSETPDFQGSDLTVASVSPPIAEERKQLSEWVQLLISELEKSNPTEDSEKRKLTTTIIEKANAYREVLRKPQYEELPTAKAYADYCRAMYSHSNAQSDPLITAAQNYASSLAIRPTKQDATSEHDFHKKASQSYANLAKEYHDKVKSHAAIAPHAEVFAQSAAQYAEIIAKYDSSSRDALTAHGHLVQSHKTLVSEWGSLLRSGAIQIVGSEKPPETATRAIEELGTQLKMKEEALRAATQQHADSTAVLHREVADLSKQKLVLEAEQIKNQEQHIKTIRKLMAQKVKQAKQSRKVLIAAKTTLARAKKSHAENVKELKEKVTQISKRAEEEQASATSQMQELSNQTSELHRRISAHEEEIGNRKKQAQALQSIIVEKEAALKVGKTDRDKLNRDLDLLRGTHEALKRTAQEQQERASHSELTAQELDRQLTGERGRAQAAHEAHAEAINQLTTDLNTKEKELSAATRQFAAKDEEKNDALALQLSMLAKTHAKDLKSQEALLQAQHAAQVTEFQKSEKLLSGALTSAQEASRSAREETKRNATALAEHKKQNEQLLAALSTLQEEIRTLKAEPRDEKNFPEKLYRLSEAIEKEEQKLLEYHYVGCKKDDLTINATDNETVKANKEELLAMCGRIFTEKEKLNKLILSLRTASFNWNAISNRHHNLQTCTPESAGYHKSVVEDLNTQLNQILKKFPSIDYKAP